MSFQLKPSSPKHVVHPAFQPPPSLCAKSTLRLCKYPSNGICTTTAPPTTTRTKTRTYTTTTTTTSPNPSIACHRNRRTRSNIIPFCQSPNDDSDSIDNNENSDDSSSTGAGSGETTPSADALLSSSPASPASSLSSSSSSSSMRLPSPIAVIGGGGKMGSALIKGILSVENAPRIIATARSMKTLEHLPIPSSDKLTDNMAAVEQAELVIISVKPKYAASVLLDIAPTLGKRAKQNQIDNQKNPPIVISVVAGFTTTIIQSFLSKAGTKIPVVRVMPNIPASIACGCTSICQDEYTSEESIKVAQDVLQCVGSVHNVAEDLLPAATAIAGSGVAYLFMAAEALADAGVKHGLDRKTALQMAADTIYGAGALLRKGEHPAVLRNSVESPAGVTVAATMTLEEEGFRSALIGAVDAAVERQFEMEEDEEDG